MNLSGISTAMQNSLSLVTVEGENTVLYQQTARYGFDGQSFLLFFYCYVNEHLLYRLLISHTCCKFVRLLVLICKMKINVASLVIFTFLNLF